LTATSINLQSVTTTGDQIYNGAMLLTTNTVLDAGAGNINLGGTINGGFKLDVNSTATTTFGDAVGFGSPLGGLNANARGRTVFSKGGVTSSGNQAYGDPVTIGADVSFNGGISLIDFQSTIDGAHQFIDNSFHLQFEGAIGSTTPLTSITLTGSFGLKISGGA